MKVFVMHDDTGKIRGTFATTKDNVGVNPKKGMKLHVLERETLEGEELKQYLGELHTTYRVDSSAEGGLVKLKA
jgi:hypothetical protein